MLRTPPVWITLSLQEPLTAAAFAARAAAHGVRAEVAARGPMQLPDGFLAWIGEGPFPAHLADRSATRAQVAFGPACLHISGGTNEFALRARDDTEVIRAMKAQMAAEMREVTTLPGTAPRVISSAALKVERLTAIVRGLLPLATSVILPAANHICFSAAEFEEMSRGYGSESYHFPLYVFFKGRPDEDGPYGSTAGMFLFGLPEVAMPLSDELDQRAAALAVGNLQREMVAEGWWPEDGATFETELGPVFIERVKDALFVVPEEVEFDDESLANARHRWALERCAVEAFGRGTMHRTRGEDTDILVDHHLHERGSFAMTNGLSLLPQEGGRAEDENEFVELILRSDRLGPWASGWLEGIAMMIRGGDGSHPFRPYSRIVRPEPANGIAALLLWPQGHFTPFGEPEEPEDADDADHTDDADDSDDVDDSRSMVEEQRARVHLWVLLPILTEELAHFRANPKNVQAWIAARIERKDLDSIHERWARGG